VYENKWVLDYDEDDLATMPILVEANFLDSLFSLLDFGIQLFVLAIYALNILTQEGYTDYLSPDTGAYQFLSDRGLAKNVSLIALFTLAHVNQTKYIGISQADHFQYLAIRGLPFWLVTMILAKSNLDGTFKSHLCLLFLMLFYLFYFICTDCKNSRQNQLALYFDDWLNDDF